MSAVSDVLNGAADLIERDGWCQFQYRVGHARCVSRALSDVGARTEETNRACAVFAVVVGHAPVSFNDAPGRTKAEVVAALRAAAERAT